MVGWSRRNRESRERARRYQAWFDAQPPEEQERIRREREERWERDKWKVYVMLILGFFVMFVVWPLGVIFLRPR